MSGKCSPEIHRKACRDYYWRNRDWINAKRRERYKTAAKPAFVWDTKSKARDALRRAVKQGKIVRPNKCDKCAKRKLIHAHHTDYTKPYDVQWLCAKCHGLEHRI